MFGDHANLPQRPEPLSPTNLPNQSGRDSPWPAVLDYGDASADSPLLPRKKRPAILQHEDGPLSERDPRALTIAMPSTSHQRAGQDNSPAEPSPLSMLADAAHDESNGMDVDAPTDPTVDASSSPPYSPHLSDTHPSSEEVVRDGGHKPNEDMGVGSADLAIPKSTILSLLMSIHSTPTMTPTKPLGSQADPIVIEDSSDPDTSKEIPLSTLRRLSNPPNPGPSMTTEAPRSSSVPVPGGRGWWAVGSTAVAAPRAPSVDEELDKVAEPEPEADELDASPLPSPTPKMRGRPRKGLSVVVPPPPQPEQQAPQAPQPTPVTVLPPYVQQIISSRTPRTPVFDTTREGPITEPAGQSAPEPMDPEPPKRRRGRPPKTAVPQTAGPSAVPKSAIPKSAVPKTKAAPKSAVPKGKGKGKEPAHVEPEALPLPPRTPPPRTVDPKDAMWSPRELKQLDRQAAAKVARFQRMATTPGRVQQREDIHMETEVPEPEVIPAANKYQPNNTLFGTGSGGGASGTRSQFGHDNHGPQSGHHASSSYEPRAPYGGVQQHRQNQAEYADHPEHPGQPDHLERHEQYQHHHQHQHQQHAQHAQHQHAQHQHAQHQHAQHQHAQHQHAQHQHAQHQHAQHQHAQHQHAQHQHAQHQHAQHQQYQQDQHPDQHPGDEPNNHPHVSNEQLNRILRPRLTTDRVLSGSRVAPLADLPPNISFDDEYTVGDFIIITSDDVLFRLDGPDLAHASRELYAARAHTPSGERFLVLRHPHENAAMFRAFLALLLRSDLPIDGDEYTIAETLRDLFAFLDGWGSNKVKIAAMILRDKLPTMTLAMALSVGGAVHDDMIIEMALHRWARVTMSIAGPGEDVCKPGLPGHAAVTDPKNWDFGRYEAMPRDYVYALTSAWAVTTATRYLPHELDDLVVRNFREALRDARAQAQNRKRGAEDRVGGEKKMREE
ncbi:hypothetical protein CspHIS471_0102070 [Cutaneotrichosporon sp. HIS471]|nr:hypothetical protein CspHIS471_0102070 [Cutaneotrichosporon sp. HIS471]